MNTAWVGKRAVRLDKAKNRVPGMYVVRESWGEDAYVRLHVERGSGGKGGVFSRRNVRIEGVDADFVWYQDHPPAEKDEAKALLREVWLASVMTEAVAENIADAETIGDVVGGADPALAKRVRRVLGEDGG